MTEPQPAHSLSKLSIDRSAAPPKRRRPLWKRWWVWLLALVAIGAAAAFVGQRNRPLAVEIATVASA